MKKFFAILLVVLLTASCFTGCTQTPATAGDTTAAGEAAATEAAAEATDAPAPAETKELDFFWWSDGNEGEVMQGLIDEYEGMNPGIQINLIEIPFADMSNKIMMSVAGGEAPALTRTTEGISNNCYESYVDIGQYTDADALISQFMPSIESYYVKNGKVISVPSDVTANGMIYNKTAFDKAGVSVPTGPDDIWTWDEFVADLKQVVEKGGVQYGMVIDNPSHRWATILYEFGGSIANENGGNLSSESSQNAIKFTKSLFDQGLVVSAPWLTSDDPNNIFRSGTVAVQIAGNWMIQNYEENIKDFEWGVTYMPTQVQRSSVPGGKQIAAIQGSGYEKEAVDFILWVTQKEQSKKYCEQSLFISPRLDCAELEYPYRSDEFAVFANELANTPASAAFDWGYPGLSAAFFTDLTSGWADVLNGTTTPEDFAAHIDSLCNEVILAK